jgi:RimJ/RimL family protein N-acetyltransferase
MIPISFQTKNGQQATIRPLEAGDADQLLAYANALSDEDTFVQLSGEHMTLAEEKSFVAKHLESMAKGDSVHLVVLVGNVVAGLGGVERGIKRKHHVGLLNIALGQAFRGKGVGEVLLRTLIQESKTSLGLRLVILTCFAINTAAIALYTKVGFRKAGEIPDMYAFKGSYEPEVTMYLPL